MLCARELIYVHSYPAGFVWTYLPLYHISNAGSNIRLAQYVFGALYVATMAVVLHLYRYDGKVSLLRQRVADVISPHAE